MSLMKGRRQAGTLAMIVLLSAGADGRGQEADDLARCNSIDDAGERLACYDAASGRNAEERPVAAEPEVSALSDDIGQEQITQGDRPDDESTLVRGTVTNCQRDASGRYYFYFENGQVWKQKDERKLRHRSCSFDVLITRDFFGYRMQVVGEENEIRISRVR